MIYFDNNKQAYNYKIDNYISCVSDDVWAEYAETDKWDIIDGVFTDITDTDEYILEQARKEKDRISKLTCTKRVFVLMLEKIGLDYFEQILPLIESNRQAKLEWDLCVSLERSNELLDIFASQLGVTPMQLDKLFQYANGENVELEVING